MNRDRIEGNWKQFTGAVKAQWGKLNNNQWDIIEGQRDQLNGETQERHGIAQDEMHKQLADWQKRMKAASSVQSHH